MIATGAAPVPVGRNTGRDLKRAALHAFLIAMAVLWLLPLAFAVYTSLRPREETDAAATCPCRRPSTWTTTSTPGTRRSWCATS